MIRPYRCEGMWVFDDPAVGLVREPFVAGIPPMIDHAVREIPDADKGFLAIFSADYIPEAQLALDRVKTEDRWTAYRWPETGQEGWLCPALFKYFDEAPAKLYVQVKPAG